MPRRRLTWRRIKGETSQMSEQPLIFDLGKRPPTTRAIALDIRARGDAALDEAQRRGGGAGDPGGTARAAGGRGSLPASHMPVGVNPRQGNAVQLDIDPVPRRHAPLPLLLRPAVPDAV